ncbi:MAG: alpha/beta fold hydrolase [Planctomycetes bacterium]|nr:alpha/beta fold hydrolase [Planctomycetota bacterium]
MDLADDHFTLTGANGALIRGDIYLPNAANSPLVVVIPGFKGFKDWGFFPWLGAHLAQAGIAAACINLSHCGIGTNPETFERLDLFEADTWSKRLIDIQQVLHAAQHGLLTQKASPNPARLGLLGHSMGGGAALLAATRDPRVRSVVTLAGVAHPNRIPDDIARAQLAAMGHVAVENARTKQTMRIGREFFEEVWGNPSAFSVIDAARALGVPWLIVHGADDETVPLDEAYELLDAAGDRDNVKMLTLDGTGHTFGAAHPFAGPTEELEQAADAAAAHFLRTL